MYINRSEVARTKADIELQYAAAQYALHTPSLGEAKHKFITRKMERMGELHEELKKRIGKEKAAKFLVHTMNGGVFQDKC